MPSAYLASFLKMSRQTLTTKTFLTKGKLALAETASKEKTDLDTGRGSSIAEAGPKKGPYNRAPPGAHLTDNKKQHIEKEGTWGPRLALAVVSFHTLENTPS